MMQQPDAPDIEALVASAIVSQSPGNGTGAEPLPAHRFTLHSAREAWEPQPPKTWIIEGLVGAGDIVLFFGDAGLGKTYILIDAAICVARAEPWLNRSTIAAPVLIVDEESGYVRLTDRLARTMRGHGVAPGTDIAVHYIVLAGFNFLSDPSWFADLRGAIVGTGARLVIIDALADVMLGGDENAVRDTQTSFHGLRSVAEATGAAIIVIHHTNKNGGYRGSTAINGSVDLALQVSHGQAAGTLEIKSVKARDIEPVRFACRPTWDAVTESFHLEPVDRRPAGRQLGKGETYVLRYLWQHPHGASKLDIEAHADTCSAGTAKNAIYDLVSKALVRRTDDGQEREAATYALTIEGQRVAEAVTFP